MAMSYMDYSLHDIGPNFEGRWNSNCQLCGKDVERGQGYFKKPDGLPLKEESPYPIVHSVCLVELYEKK